MVGNSAEEALLTKLDYPGHADPARLGGLAGAACGIFTGILISGLFGPAVGVPLGLIAGFSVGLALWRRLEKRALERRAAEKQAKRDQQAAEQRRQMRAMK